MAAPASVKFDPKCPDGVRRSVFEQDVEPEKSSWSCISAVRMVGDTEDAEEKRRSHSCRRGGLVASTARFLTPKVTVYILSTFTAVLSPWPWSSCRRMRWEVMRDFVGFVTALNKRRNVCLSRQAQMDTMKEFKLNVILAPLGGLMCPDCIQHGNLVAWHTFSSLIFVVGRTEKKEAPFMWNKYSNI